MTTEIAGQEEQLEQPAATYEVRGNVALITLNRPRALNAVNAALSTAVGTVPESEREPVQVTTGVHVSDVVILEHRSATRGCRTERWTPHE